MVRYALLARVEAKEGKEEDVSLFLKDALTMAQKEEDTTHWFAMQIGPTTFGIFDTFNTDGGHKAHLSTAITTALMENTNKLLAKQPVIEQVA